MGDIEKKKQLFKSLSKSHNSPKKVQKLLRTFLYNKETDGETACSASVALRNELAHCLEGSAIAAAILEHHGHPPLILCLDSIDFLNHVVFVYKTKTGWGAVGKSRCPGLHGRAPKFRSIRDLALSYYEPFVDETGEMIGYILLNLDESGTDWRHSEKNLWKLEQFVVNAKYTKINPSKKRFEKLKERYLIKGHIKRGKHWW
jgi:hypothetical protein